MAFTSAYPSAHGMESIVKKYMLWQTPTASTDAHHNVSINYFLFLVWQENCQWSEMNILNCSLRCLIRNILHYNPRLSMSVPLIEESAHEKVFHHHHIYHFQMCFLWGLTPSHVWSQQITYHGMRTVQIGTFLCQLSLIHCPWVISLNSR